MSAHNDPGPERVEPVLPAEYVDADPDPRDLVRELRVALGWGDVALPISPKQAWEDCLAEVRRLVRMDQL